MKQLRIFFAVSLLAVLLALCGGCRRTDEIPEGVPEYTVYYLDSPGLKLVGNSIGMEGTDQEALVQELLSRMETVPAELDCQSAIPERVETITFRIEENVLYLFVDANYALMDSVREILCRAAPYENADSDPGHRLSEYLLCRAAHCGRHRKSCGDAFGLRFC